MDRRNLSASFSAKNIMTPNQYEQSIMNQKYGYNNSFESSSKSLGIPNLSIQKTMPRQPRKKYESGSHEDFYGNFFETDSRQSMNHGSKSSRKGHKNRNKNKKSKFMKKKKKNVYNDDTSNESSDDSAIVIYAEESEDERYKQSRKQKKKNRRSRSIEYSNNNQQNEYMKQPAGSPLYLQTPMPMNNQNQGFGQGNQGFGQGNQGMIPAGSVFMRPFQPTPMQPPLYPLPTLMSPMPQMQGGMQNNMNPGQPPSNYYDTLYTHLIK